jgi:hypothetical protein
MHTFLNGDSKHHTHLFHSARRNGKCHAGLVGVEDVSVKGVFKMKRVRLLSLSSQDFPAVHDDDISHLSDFFSCLDQE